MSFKQKLDHFWYYYKTYVLFGALLVVALLVALYSCTNRRNCDVNILYMTHGYSDSMYQTDELAVMFGEFAPDVNGDGATDAQIISIHYGKTADEIVSANATRSANLAAGKNLLFLMDEQNYTELKNGGFLEDISDLGSSEYLVGDRFEIYNSGLLDEISGFKAVGDQYYLCLRVYDETKAESDNSYRTQYAAAKQLLVNIIKAA